MGNVDWNKSTETQNGSQLLNLNFCLESFKSLTFNIRPRTTFPFISYIYLDKK